MNCLSSEDTQALFKKIISESDTSFKIKEYDKAYKTLNEASLLISKTISKSPEVYERNIYYGNLITLKDKQSDICIKEKNPNYDYFLIFYLESFALDIVRDLNSFPHLSGFYYRKESKYAPYSGDFGSCSLKISPDEDTNIFVALKKLKIFQWRNEILTEYLDFIYKELPEIYGIPSDFNKGSLTEILDKKTYDVIFITKTLPDYIGQKAVGRVPFEINKFITNLLKKYYDLEND
ncbi:MAG: hypothetical protein WCS03_06510 [Bacteroidota bacterium]